MRGVSGAAYATPLELAHDIKAAADTAAVRLAEQAERERRKAERQANKAGRSARGPEGSSELTRV